jgi:Activator of Hsp90 ATPase homolog 1-like protein
MTTLTAESIENLTLEVKQEMRVRAALATTFAALLEELGPSSQRPDGTPMMMKIEPWPGGRWFRDLGDGNGHCWAIVQSIKQPTLLEFYGPLFMSQPVANHVIYRLSQEGNETVIKFSHNAFGPIPPEHREGVNKGWTHMHSKVRERAERA